MLAENPDNLLLAGIQTVSEVTDTMTAAVRKSWWHHVAGRQGHQYINDKEPWVLAKTANPSSCRRFAAD